ncbi:hypothetical protein [Halonotius roseus]|uniref:Uncharacterized protein n=1 Tax=Halonotius roseus TaxID=2511997 RepID=A0A544QR25_9EURY|nr:hypothetical protein [Halonotius roseus]TQQ81895.1 hypothetical protein EWF95_02855 [Halonotius roseus]
MSKSASILQEVVWETYKGTFGSSTLLKEVAHETMCCPDCEVPGRYDSDGMIVCPKECGRIISDAPLMVPEDSFDSYGSSGPSGDSPTPALNDMTMPEPDVQ